MAIQEALCDAVPAKRYALRVKNPQACNKALSRFYLREILQDDSGGLERNVGVSLRVLDPVEDLLDIRGLNIELITVTHG